MGASRQGREGKGLAFPRGGIRGWVVCLYGGSARGLVSEELSIVCRGLGVHNDRGVVGGLTCRSGFKGIASERG